MDLKERKNLLVVCALASFAIFGGDRFVLTPLTQAWDARAQEIAKLQRDLNKAQALLERRSQFDRTWKEMKDSGLSTDQTAAEALILKSVDGWARESGLTVGSIKPRLTQGSEEWPTLEFRASARGSLESIVRFIWMLETSAMPLRVVEVEIASHEKALNDMTATLTFSGLLMASPGTGEADRAGKPKQEEI